METLEDAGLWRIPHLHAGKKRDCYTMSTVAIYPGTFDPITLGHVDLIKRAAHLFDRLILAVSASTWKSPLFTLTERLAMARSLAASLPHVEVDSFDGLLVDYVRRKKAHVVLRGLRAFSDFEYEFQMALTNQKMAPDIETMFLMPNEIYTYVSSTMVREVAALGGDTSVFVPDFVQTELRKKWRKSRGRCLRKQKRG
jgi:pantetheine-phosphate adenylyltransferase